MIRFTVEVVTMTCTAEQETTRLTAKPATIRCMASWEMTAFSEVKATTTSPLTTASPSTRTRREMIPSIPTTTASTGDSARRFGVDPHESETLVSQARSYGS